MRPSLLRTLSALLLAATACEGPFAHTNPYHPDGDFDMLIVGGANSSDSANDTLVFELDISPDAPRQTVQWSLTPIFLTNLNDGRFVTTAGGLAPRTVTIIAGFGDRRVTRQITVQQVPVELDLRCQGLNACAAFTSLGSQYYPEPFVRDAKGQPIPIFGTFPVNTLVSRDPAVVSVQGGGTLLPISPIRSEGAGSTYVVGEIFGFRDSLLVTVVLP